MDVVSYIRPKSKIVGDTEYEKGRTYAFKSMVNIYFLLRKSFDQTRQSIYFFSYLKRMRETCGEKEGEFARGQVDAYTETYEHFRPSKKKEIKNA
jgi:hypothetical protein